MTLLCLILVVLLERLIKPSEQFHYRHYYHQYQQFSQTFLKSANKLSPELYLVIWLAIPVISVAIIQALLGHGLLGVAFSVAVLFLCYGCPQHRKSYQQYIEAACRDDQQACFIYSEQLGQQYSSTQNSNRCESLGEALVWINFRHYFAVIFWFVLLGAAGAVLYVFARNLAKNLALENTNQQNTNQQNPDTQNIDTANLDDIPNSDTANPDTANPDTANPDTPNSDIKIDQNDINEQKSLAQASNRLLAILVWLPARLTGFAFLFVGHFSRAMPAWLSGLFDFNQDARPYLANIAKAAEQVEVPENDCLTEPCLMLKLAKRAFLFLLSVIAILTLSGII